MNTLKEISEQIEEYYSVEQTLDRVIGLIEQLEAEKRSLTVFRDMKEVEETMHKVAESCKHYHLKKH